MQLIAHGSQKAESDSAGVTVVSQLMWVLGLKVGPLQEQQALLVAEPSLQFLESPLEGHESYT